MLTDKERDLIRLKAFEQAMRTADLAKSDIEPLLVLDSWPFKLSLLDREILKLLKISAA